MIHTRSECEENRDVEAVQWIQDLWNKVCEVIP